MIEYQTVNQRCVWCGRWTPTRKKVIKVVRRQLIRNKDRDKRIVERALVDKESYGVISKRYGITRQRVSQIVRTYEFRELLKDNRPRLRAGIRIKRITKDDKSTQQRIALVFEKEGG